MDILKFGIAGAHSCGKTTQLNQIKSLYPGLHYVTEAARDCPFPLNEASNFTSQDWIFRTHVTREMMGPLNGITLTDRTTYDQLAYIWSAYERGNMTYDEFKKLEKYTTYWGFTYDLIFYIPVEFPMTEDGVRSTDVEYRDEISKKVKAILDEYVDSSRIVLITGSIEERTKKMQETILEMTRNSNIPLA